MEPSATGRRLSPCAEFPNDNPALHHGAIWRCDALSGELTVRLPSPQPASALARMASEGLAKLARVVAGEPVEGSEAPHRGYEAVLDEDAVVGESDAADCEPDAMAEADTVVEAEAVTEPDAVVRPDSIAVPEVERPVAIAEPEESIAELDAMDAGPDAPYEENDEPDAIEIVDDLCFSEAIDEADGAASAPPPAAEDPFARLIHALEGVAIVHGAGEESIGCLRALFGVTRSDGMAPGERATEALLAAGIVLESAQEGRGLVRSGPFTSQVIAWQGILRGESDDFTACGGAALDEWAAGVLARVLGSPSKAEGIRRDLRGRGVAAFGLLADAA
jgi:hypothetical protein